VLGFFASLLHILLSGHNQGGHWYGTARAKDLLLGVEGAWVQFVMQVQFCVWLVLDGVVYVQALSRW
jgi:hypothetical protein